MRRILSTLVCLVSWTAVAVAQQPSGKLVIYTSQQPDVAQQTVDAFKAKNPRVEVEWTRNGTGPLMNVLRAEITAGDVKPDILFVADEINLGQLKIEKRLLAYPQANVAVYDKVFHDPDRFYFGTKVVATGIAYNTRAAKKPTSWWDLTKPEVKGQVAVPSPLFSGAALAVLHAFLEAPGLGWDYYRALSKNGVVPQGGNGPALNAVSGGRALYGIIADGDVFRAKSEGSPVDLAYPSEGVSFITEPVAIMSTARNVPAAKAFIDFLISKEGQELVAKQGNLAIHPDVASPPGFPKLSDIKLLPLDARKAVTGDTEVKKTYSSIFGG